jgi:hypothetical protein
MLKRTSRAYLAGVALGKALVEMVNLMYQENTARNFFSGVLSELGKSKRHFGKKRTPKSSKVAPRSTSTQQAKVFIKPGWCRYNGDGCLHIDPMCSNISSGGCTYHRPV